MITLIVPMKAEQVIAVCEVDGCGGHLVSTGQGFTNTWGTTWEHKCNACGGIVSIHGQSYPYIRHVPVDQV